MQIEEKEKYVNPFTDFGFKRLFGEEPSKDLLKDFLNELLREEQGEIIDLQYLKTEQLSGTKQDRKAFFDLYCTNEKGERFIVELQKTKQNFFKDRTVYYSTFPIRDQAKRGDWDFKLNAVYTIAILDFVFDEDKDNPNKYFYSVKLTDQETKEIFYDKLTFIYLAMPKFNKTIDELETQFDKWLYVLKNLTTLQTVPSKLHEEKFLKLFELAEIAQFNQAEQFNYESSLKEYWNLNSCYNTAHQEGIEEGRDEKAREIAHNLKQAGVDIETIIKATNLSAEEIEKL